MWPSKLIASIKAQLKAMNEPLRDGEQARAFADAAYQSCVEWFGPPPDPKRRYELVNRIFPGGSCGYALGSYHISVSTTLTSPEQLCAVIGHEMYHRVTMRRRTLRREVWVDEMLAFYASLWFLERQGYRDYAGFLRDDAANEPEPVDLSMLRSYRRISRFAAMWRGVEPYPKDFYSGTERVGLALAKLVGGKSFRRLSQAKSWDEWLDSLPDHQHALVVCFLRLPGADKRIPVNADCHRCLGYAYRVIGQFDDALAEYQESLRLRPDDADTFFQMGFVFEQRQQPDKAAFVWTRAARLDPQNVWAASNLADEYYRREAYPAAIIWYKEALKRRPDWPRALFYLGGALFHNGDVAEARETWQRIVEIGDKTYAQAAKESLDKWKETAPALAGDPSLLRGGEEGIAADI